MKFIIVDNEIREIKHMEKILNEVVNEDKEILKFTKCSPKLEEEIRKVGEIKVYILGIELGTKVSGINIAKHIREIDWESEIIFVTHHDDMFETAHREVHKVYDFIEKFHNFDNRFKKDIKEILTRNYDGKIFKYKTKQNNVLRIYYKHILYIYRDTGDRKLIIVTDHQNEFSVHLSLREIITKLDKRFVQCHKSCIVNTERVIEKNYKDGYFKLDNGEKIDMLSKKYRKNFDKAQNKHELKTKV